LICVQQFVVFNISEHDVLMNKAGKMNNKSVNSVVFDTQVGTIYRWYL